MQRSQASRTTGCSSASARSRGQKKPHESIVVSYYLKFLVSRRGSDQPTKIEICASANSRLSRVLEKNCNSKLHPRFQQRNARMHMHMTGGDWSCSDLPRHRRTFRRWELSCSGLPDLLHLRCPTTCEASMRGTSSECSQVVLLTSIQMP